jgi:hypothetical protein
MQRVVGKIIKRSRKTRLPALHKQQQLELPMPVDIHQKHEIDPEAKPKASSEVLFNINEDDCTDQFVIKLEDTYCW